MRMVPPPEVSISQPTASAYFTEDQTFALAAALYFRLNNSSVNGALPFTPETILTRLHQIAVSANRSRSTLDGDFYDKFIGIITSIPGQEIPPMSQNGQVQHFLLALTHLLIPPNHSANQFLRHLLSDYSRAVKQSR
ncbi:hypothetical protein HY386_02840 [Candidatus Daviesbacteria bacterium]|nr:hypothetical protein [Candidatus Daviesbacteria bacterium]